MWRENDTHDLRGRFPRAWSNGSSVDPGRAFGTAQEDAIRPITGSFTFPANRVDVTTGAFYLDVPMTPSITSSGTAGNSLDTVIFDASRVVPVASENIVKNTALYACVKF